MATFSESDLLEINDSYKNMLIGLKDYLIQYNIKDEIAYSKYIIDMLHKGLFSTDGKIYFDNYYDYLGLSSKISQGVHVTYGICCCRHATDFLYDFLVFLGFNPTLEFYFIDNENGIWHKVNPAVDKVNHQAILSSDDKYIIDPANKFILQVSPNGEVTPLDIKINHKIDTYRDPHIETIGKILKKYYIYKELGVENVY